MTLGKTVEGWPGFSGPETSKWMLSSRWNNNGPQRYPIHLLLRSDARYVQSVSRAPPFSLMLEICVSQI